MFVAYHPHFIAKYFLDIAKFPLKLALPFALLYKKLRDTLIDKKSTFPNITVNAIWLICNL